ncbi:hypothetical protein [Hydrogenimonas thermophila]|nr:hypothetical protein [Hydrogenimonas thermophila]WOE69595.1 hypothetical protein RZR91_10875 [Hydrogenimonas thermophila]
MNKKIVVCVGIVTALVLSGCGSSASSVSPKSSEKTNKTSMKSSSKADDFQIGKTTKEEILAKYGKPNSVSVSANGIETLIYTRSHITGKAWIPFYYGSDRVRSYTKIFKFKNGVLTDYTTSENHY